MTIAYLGLVLAGSAFETKDDLLGGLGLFVEDRLGLTTVTCAAKSLNICGKRNTVLTGTDLIAFGRCGRKHGQHPLRDLNWL